MIKFIYLLIFFTILSHFGSAQQIVPLNEKTYTDSLNNVLRQTTSDSIKARANYLLSDYWRAKDTVKGKAYLLEGRRFGNKYPLTKALYFYFEGQLYFNFNTDKAADAFFKAYHELMALKSKEAYKFQSMAIFNYGIMKRPEKGDEFFFDITLNKAIPLSEKAGDPEKTAHYYAQLGTALMYNGQFEKAGTYIVRAIDLLKKKYPNSTTLLFAYLSATSNYIYSDKNKDAKEMLDKAGAILKPYPESVNYPYYYYNEALYYTAILQLDNALVSLNNGITMAEKLNQLPLLQMLVFRKYNVYVDQKKYKQAKQLLTGLLKTGQLTQDLNNRKIVYANLAKTNASLGLMGEAYKWSSAYSTLSDSLYESHLKERISAMEVKYRNAENQKKIAILETERQKAILSAKNNRLNNWLLGASSICLLIIAVSSTFYYRSGKKLLAQKEINHRQQLKELEQQQKLTVTKAILTGEEKERTRVARDLHDGLGGMLAGVKINLSGWMAGNDMKEQDVEFHQIIGQLDNSVNELRRIARNMMPETLLKFGLETALKDLCESLMTKDIHIDFQTFGIEKDIATSAQIAIYRIVQEIMANSFRHAKATNIVLQCSQNNSVFFITAEDNGIGFDTEALNKGTGMGLNNIKNRIDYLNGKLDITSAINEGTTINIELNVA
jgi:two-component system NarL family sensor kinase